MRIAVVTPFFPTSNQQYRGHSAYQTLARLQRWAEVEVICPLATYPDWFRPRNFAWVRPDLDYCPPHVKAQYFEYPALPGITRPLNGAVCAHRLEPRLRKLRADLVINYWLYPEGYAAVKTAHRLGLPAIVCSIGSDLNSIPDAITRHFMGRTVQTADFVLTVSRQLANRAIELGASRSKVRTIMNGCDSSIFHVCDRKQARRELGMPADSTAIVFVGRLIRTKGVVELMEAFEALSRIRADLRLVYVGDGPLKEVLADRAEGSGLLDRVVFPGSCDSPAVARWLAAADIFALPTYAEGCPNVVIEALHCGRPVVASSVGAIPELVDSSCGILVPPQDAGKLTEALSEALDRSWDELEISRKRSRSWEDVAGDLFNVCNEVVGAKRGS